MGVAPDEGRGGLSPDEAFGLLGNEIRVQILQALGEATEPLSFTALRDRVGIRQGGQFNYHLEKVVGHFVGKTEAGYVLRQPGRRVVQAVLSGAVTDDPELAYTEIDAECWWCGTSIVVRYDQERLDLFCPGCEGTYGDSGSRRPSQVAGTVPEIPDGMGYLGAFLLPPAGVKERSPEAAFQAGLVWEMLEYFAISSGVCPRCSGPIEQSVDVCESHDTTEGLCRTCGNRKAVHLRICCPTCLYRNRGVFVYSLYGEPAVMAFFTTHGIPLLSFDGADHLFRVAGAYEEDVHSVKPFEATFTFTIDDASVALTVDDDLEVVDVVRS